MEGEGTTGLGKPLKLIEQPFRNEIPIYLAAVGLKNVELTAEIAEGWLPFMYSPIKGEDIYKESLNNGFKKSGDSDKKINLKLSQLYLVVFAKRMKLINIYIPHEIFIRFMLEVWAQNQKTSITTYFVNMGMKILQMSFKIFI